MNANQNPPQQQLHPLVAAVDTALTSIDTAVAKLPLSRQSHGEIAAAFQQAMPPLRKALEETIVESDRLKAELESKQAEIAKLSQELRLQFESARPSVNKS